MNIDENQHQKSDKTYDEKFDITIYKPSKPQDLPTLGELMIYDFKSGKTYPEKNNKK